MTIDRRTFLSHSAGAVAAITVLPEIALGKPIELGAPVGVGVVGAGRQGRAILAELQKIEAVKVAALCDSDQSRLRSGMRRAQGATPYATLDELLDKGTDVDAVFIATPTHTHRALAIAAMQAGKHVYCEAPLASTIEDAKAIADAARGVSTIVQAGMHGRSNPVYQLARSFYRAGSCGDLVSMRAQYHRKQTWRTPASDPAREKLLNWRLDDALSLGLVGEFGTHQLDVLHWFTGRYPTRVSGHGGIHHHDDGRKVADTAQCTFEWQSGHIVQYEASLGSSYGGKYEILGGSDATMKLGWSHGWMFKEADAPTQGWEVYANRQQFHNDEGITLIADATQLASQGKLKEGVGLPHPSLYYAVADFLKSVAEGARVTTTADEGYRATVVGILANQAVTSGSAVDIDPALLQGS